MELYQKLFGRFAAPANEDGGDAGGGVVDRGYDFVPTDDDEAVDKKEAADDKAEDKKEAADDKKEGDEGDDKGKKIPEARFTEAIRKHKDRQAALEARIKELEGAATSTKVSKDIQGVEADIDKLQDEYEEAIADNNKDKMKAIRAKIKAGERTLIELKADERAQAAKRETLEELRYEAAIEKVETDYPIINPDSDEFDDAKAQEVLDLRNAMMKTGVSAAKALQRAVKYVLGEPAGVKSKEDVEGIKKQREEDARKKAAEANKKQPVDTDGVGLDSDKAGGEKARKQSVAKMSQEEFAKLSETELSKLRGDSL
jgi:hypothetical protein